MRTRSLIKDTASRGATVLATVESVALGHATVRLVRNGARLTNLPVLGSTIKPADKVIVDYSGEGRPIVRPLTIIPDARTDPSLDIAERVVRPEPEEEIPEEGPTDNTWFPVVGRYTNTNPGYIQYKTTASVIVHLPDCIFATYPNWVSNGWFKPQIPGTYAMRITIGFECDSWEWESYGIWLNWQAQAWSDYYATSDNYRGGYNQESPVVIQATALHKVPIGAPGANEELFFWPSFRYSDGFTRRPNILYAPGKYPVFEYWMVAPITTQAPSGYHPAWPWSIWY